MDWCLVKHWQTWHQRKDRFPSAGNRYDVVVFWVVMSLRQRVGCVYLGDPGFTSGSVQMCQVSVWMLSEFWNQTFFSHGWLKYLFHVILRNDHQKCVVLFLLLQQLCSQQPNERNTIKFGFSFSILDLVCRIISSAWYLLLKLVGAFRGIFTLSALEKAFCCSHLLQL